MDAVSVIKRYKNRKDKRFSIFLFLQCFIFPTQLIYQPDAAFNHAQSRFQLVHGVRLQQDLYRFAEPFAVVGLVQIRQVLTMLCHIQMHGLAVAGLFLFDDKLLFDQLIDILRGGADGA